MTPDSWGHNIIRRETRNDTRPACQVATNNQIDTVHPQFLSDLIAPF